MSATKPPICLYRYKAITNSIDLSRFLMAVPIWLTVALFGLVGNTLAYIVLRKELRPSSTAFLLKALAIVDNLVLVTFTLDDSLVRIFVSQGVLEAYYEFYMLAHPYIWPIKWIAKMLSVYTIILVTVERYIAVCKPLRATYLCTIRKSKIAFCALCFFSILYNIPKFWQLETTYRYDKCTERYRPIYLTRKSFKSSVFWTTGYSVALYIIFMFIIPLLALAILNVFLIRALASSVPSGTGSDRRSQESKAITKRIVAIVIIFVLLELPTFLLNILNLLRESALDLNGYLIIHLMQCAYVISAMNSVINFYVYCLTGSSFRRTLRKMLFCCSKDGDRGRRGQPSVTETNCTEVTCI